MGLSREQFIIFLEYEGACISAKKWIEKQKGKTPRQLWNMCGNPKWLCWLANRFDSYIINSYSYPYSRIFRDASNVLHTAFKMLGITVVDSYDFNNKKLSNDFRKQMFQEIKLMTVNFRKHMPWEMVEEQIEKRLLYISKNEMRRGSDGGGDSKSRERGKYKWKIKVALSFGM